MKPLVSVIIPTYNRLHLLRQAVESVRAQTYDRWELIVVDDGSTDETRIVLDRMGDPNVRVVSMPHSGIVGALRNAGARAAHGDYLAFLDSDDLWLPTKLETQLARMLKAGVRWSYTRYEHIDVQGRSIPPKAGVWQALSGDIAREVVNAEASVTICTVVVDKQLFFSAGPFVEDVGPYREDYDLVLRLALQAQTLAVPEMLVQVREHEERTTRGLSGAQPFLASARVYDRVFPLLRTPDLKRLARQRRAELLAEAASRSLRAGQVADGAEFLLRSLADQPFNRQWAWALARGLNLKD